jgi:beta-1,4-mannosyltransferase
MPRTVAIAGVPMAADAYTACYYQALQYEGAEVVEGELSGRWLVSHRGRLDYLHLHWPSFLYRDSGVAAGLARFMRFALLLALARLCRIRLLWTAHNLYPHERSHPAMLDRMGRTMLIRLCHRVFAHGECAAAIVAREFPAVRDKLVVIPHGHWIDYYAHGTDRVTARARLGIPQDQYVFLSFGSCREYKNLEHLVRSFQQIAPRGSALWIVGRFQDEAYAERVRRQIEERPRGIRLVNSYVPDEDVQYYFHACDSVVLAYADVLTSGGAMLALGFGRPVIAPRLGHLQDVIDAGCGILYEPREPEGLARAMEVAAGRNFDDAAILQHARRFDWRDAAARTLSALQ